MTATAHQETLQQAIDRRNRETASARRKEFGNKATDQKVHENLFICVEIFIEAFRADPASHKTHAAFQEMSMARLLSRRNLKP